MKTIKTTDITAGQAMPVKRGTLRLMQDSHKENLFAVQVSNDTLNINTITVLFGLEVTVAGPNTFVNGGAIMYNGEVYRVTGGNWALSVGEVIVCNIVENSITATDSDPVEFSNGSSFNVHLDRRIALSPGLPGSGLFNLSAVRYPHEPFADTYNAGKLDGGAAAWTIPGAGDWNVHYFVQGKKVTASFIITNGTLDFTTAYVEILMPNISGIPAFKVAKAAKGVGGFINSNNTPGHAPALIDMLPGSNRIRIIRQQSAGFAAITGGFDVYGQIVFETE